MLAWDGFYLLHALANQEDGRSVPTPSPPPAVLVLIDSDLDLGLLEDGQPRRGSLRFRNAGQVPLILDRVESSCGCTAGELSTKRLSPGQESSLEVTYDPRLRHGPFEEAIELFSNAVGSPHQFFVRGEVKGFILREPAVLFFDRPKTQTVKLTTPRSDFSFQVREIQVPPGVEVGPPEKLPDGFAFPVSWTGQQTESQGSVHFLTDREEAPWVPLGVYLGPQ